MKRGATLMSHSDYIDNGSNRRGRSSNKRARARLRGIGGVDDDEFYDEHMLGGRSMYFPSGQRGKDVDNFRDRYVDSLPRATYREGLNVNPSLPARLNTIQKTYEVQENAVYIKARLPNVYIGDTSLLNKAAEGEGDPKVDDTDDPLHQSNLAGASQRPYRTSDFGQRARRLPRSRFGRAKRNTARNMYQQNRSLDIKDAKANMFEETAADANEYMKQKQKKQMDEEDEEGKRFEDDGGEGGGDDDDDVKVAGGGDDADEGGGPVDAYEGGGRDDGKGGRENEGGQSAGGYFERLSQISQYFRGGGEEPTEGPTGGGGGGGARQERTVGSGGGGGAALDLSNADPITNSNAAYAPKGLSDPSIQVPSSDLNDAKPYWIAPAIPETSVTDGAVDTIILKKPTSSRAYVYGLSRTLGRFGNYSGKLMDIVQNPGQPYEVMQSTDGALLFDLSPIASEEEWMDVETGKPYDSPIGHPRWNSADMTLGEQASMMVTWAQGGFFLTPIEKIKTTAPRTYAKWFDPTVDYGHEERAAYMKEVVKRILTKRDTASQSETMLIAGPNATIALERENRSFTDLIQKVKPVLTTYGPAMVGAALKSANPLQFSKLSMTHASFAFAARTAIIFKNDAEWMNRVVNTATMMKRIDPAFDAEMYIEKMKDSRKRRKDEFLSQKMNFNVSMPSSSSTSWSEALQPRQLYGNALSWSSYIFDRAEQLKYAMLWIEDQVKNGHSLSMEEIAWTNAYYQTLRQVSALDRGDYTDVFDMISQLEDTYDLLNVEMSNLLRTHDWATPELLRTDLDMVSQKVWNNVMKDLVAGAPLAIGSGIPITQATISDAINILKAWQNPTFEDALSLIMFDQSSRDVIAEQISQLLTPRTV